MAKERSGKRGGNNGGIKKHSRTKHSEPNGLGHSVHQITRVIAARLNPIKPLVWGFDQIKAFVTQVVSEKLKGTPADQIVTPSPMVAGPLLEALKYAGHEPSLRDLYANLLATSMDAKTAKEAHPAFVEVLKQLSPDEAKILKVMAKGQNFPVISVDKHHKVDRNGEQREVVNWVLRHFSLLPYQAECDHPDLGPSYLENLCRLGVTIIPQWAMGASGATMTADMYPPLEQHPRILSLRAAVDATPGETSSVDHQVIRVTTYGRQFINACVTPPEQK